MIYWTHQSLLHKPEVNTLILGDSGTNPLSLLEIKNSLQMGMTGETHKLMYYKLIEFDRINDFDNVVLSCHPTQISGWANANLEVYEYIKRLYPFTNPLTLLKDNPHFKNVGQIIFKYYLCLNFDYFNHLLPSNITRSKLPFSFKYNIFKKHLPSKNPIPIMSTQPQRIAEQKAIKAHFNTHQNVGPVAVDYLKKIVTYCVENKLQLYLLRMPVTNKYRAAIPSETKETLAQLVTEFTTNKNVHYLDFADEFAAKEDTGHFYDVNHVNLYGGQIIGKKIQEAISATVK